MEVRGGCGGLGKSMGCKVLRAQLLRSWVREARELGTRSSSDAIKGGRVGWKGSVRKQARGRVGVAWKSGRALTWRAAFVFFFTLAAMLF